jgi:preprotein translocase subunit SecA
MLGVLKKLFGSSQDKKLRKFEKVIALINSLESDMIALSDEQLRNKTQEFKNLLQNNKSTLDDILPAAFATVREASKRVLGMRHFDVQLLGGLVLYHGGIAEMATGEGKTLVVTTVAYLRSLESAGMHVVTVNDYLAQRDSAWMGEIFKFLNVSVGCIISAMNDYQRNLAYKCDITYATNNELGFDYLRDNTKYDLKEKVQRKLHAACIDEVDSILIDEARTPLILSGPAKENLETWNIINKIVCALSKEHYLVDEKVGTASLSEEGALKAENLLKAQNLIDQDSDLYDMANANFVYQINQVLRAHLLFSKDVDYIVKDSLVLCINRNTGRISEGRRYGAGLHQAIEAKENVPIKEENEEIASITFQNYFRMYKNLSGMTGTATTEAEELKKTYNLTVYSIPTNKPLRRIDKDDVICATVDAKHQMICNLVKERYSVGQPVLLGTGDIQQSEILSNLLKAAHIPHSVLNAKNHMQEAFIVAQAGCFKSVTIATNMAGRGTDIMLGGNAKMMFETYKTHNPALTEQEKQKTYEMLQKKCATEKKQVIDAGGLLVIGALRNESRRIDNQLRGRSGRQGDPGVSQFFLSLDDSLIKLFASEKNISFLKRHLNPEEGGTINHPLANMAIATAQKRVENQYYEARQHLLKFDNVINEQRTLVYQQRDSFLEADDTSIKSTFLAMLEDVASSFLQNDDTSDSTQEDIYATLFKKCKTTFDLDLSPPSSSTTLEESLSLICTKAKQEYLKKEATHGAKAMAQVTRLIQVSTLDQVWRENTAELAVIKEAIQNRAYAQKDPLNEYKSEAFASFKIMLERFSALFVQRICAIEIENEETQLPTPESFLKIRRNQGCPCGSGKKYKHCHGIR